MSKFCRSGHHGRISPNPIRAILAVLAAFGATSAAVAQVDPKRGAEIYQYFSAPECEETGFP